MPRSLTNTSCVQQNPMCCLPPAPTPAPAPAPTPAALAVGSYLEIAGNTSRWRLFAQDGRLHTQKRVGSSWVSKQMFT